MTSLHKSESVGSVAGRLFLCAATLSAACAELDAPDDEAHQRRASQALSLEVSDGDPIPATDGPDAMPRSDGDIVAWLSGTSEDISGTDILVLEVGSDFPWRFERDADQVALDISGSRIAFEELDVDGGRAIVVELAAEPVLTQLGTGAGQTRPRIDGPWAVFEDRSDGGPAVVAFNLDTGEERTITLEGRTGSEPDVWGDWAAFLEPTADGNDVVVVNLVSGIQTALGVGADQPRGLAVGGGRVAFEIGPEGASDIAVVDLASAQTALIVSVIALDGAQTQPSVDGDVLVFVEHVGGETDLAAYDLATGDYVPIPASGNQSSPHLDGERVVYVHTTEAGSDIRALNVRRTAMAAADIQVNASLLDFGALEVGLVAVQTFSIANAGDADLQVDSITVASGAFTVDTTSVTLAPGASTQVAVLFSPLQAGAATGELAIVSNDPDSPRVVVALTGVGQDPPDPEVTIHTILEKFDTAMASGQLRGTGSNGLERYLRMHAVRLMLVAARILIDHEAPGACLFLHSALLRMDGSNWPKDFVEGPAVPAIAADIRTLQENLACD